MSINNELDNDSDDLSSVSTITDDGSEMIPLGNEFGTKPIVKLKETFPSPSTKSIADTVRFFNDFKANTIKGKSMPSCSSTAPTEILEYSNGQKDKSYGKCQTRILEWNVHLLPLQVTNDGITALLDQIKEKTEDLHYAYFYCPIVFVPVLDKIGLTQRIAAYSKRPKLLKDTMNRFKNYLDEFIKQEMHDDDWDILNNEDGKWTGYEVWQILAYIELQNIETTHQSGFPVLYYPVSLTPSTTSSKKVIDDDVWCEIRCLSSNFAHTPKHSSLHQIDFVTFREAIINGKKYLKEKENNSDSNFKLSTTVNLTKKMIKSRREDIQKIILETSFKYVSIPRMSLQIQPLAYKVDLGDNVPCCSNS